MNQKHFSLSPSETTVHPALKNAFGYCFYKSAMRLRAMLDHALEMHNILTPQLMLMRIIENAGPTCQCDLGKTTNIDKTSMVKFIDGLEKKGLVRRVSSAKDRRMKNIELTKAGHKMLEKIALVRDDIENAFFANLTKNEINALKSIVPKLVGHDPY